MNRILRRPMFRTGGSAEGITSGLAPRQGYKDPAGLVEQIQTKRNIIDTLAPRTPRKDTSMRDFLINFGLDIASRPPQGSIFSTAAASAKEPFAKFQQAKQMEDAYGAQEAEADRALVSDLIKGMDDDKLSALMKDVQAGVEAGEFPDEATGIKLLLRKKIYGVLDAPGEAENARIREIELMIARDQEVAAGAIRSVAEHIYKIETGAYPEDIQKDLNRTKTFIKPNHITGTKKDDEGNVIEIILDGNYARTYSPGQIYFEPQTGELFKNVSKQGEAPRFVKVIFE
jgi:hypothetical protein